MASQHDRGPLVASIRQHLQVYGYLPAHVDDCDPEQLCVHLRRAVSLFQTYFQLPVTGYVDVATLKLLTAERSGMPDVPEDVARAAALGDEGVDGSDPLINYDRDNGVAIEVYRVDGARTTPMPVSTGLPWSR